MEASAPGSVIVSWETSRVPYYRVSAEQQAKTGSELYDVNSPCWHGLEAHVTNDVAFIRSSPDERDHRLYEQAAPASPRSPGGLEGLAGRCGDYVRRWCRWVTSGLADTRWAQTLTHGGAAPGERRATLPSPQASA